ncbi:Small RNA 2'-O-methyltransferase [Lobosporangium transversale]|nr:Small RNA 2'-O-methyltransferase [Lobosporangium transversale]
MSDNESIYSLQASSNSLESLLAEQSDEARFFPPLWQQRRNLAARIIKDEHATSVIDFGCGEAALTSFLIWESTESYPITHIVGVDVAEDRLKLAEESCQPQDFELGPNLRVNPLTIEIFQGSVGQADSRFVGYDALACLEVVEHLDPDVLEKFWSVVLGALRPKIVIVSTPNVEFNIHFPQLKYGTPESIFRNDDHRFEWTRQEFETWCKDAANMYAYDVSFTGVGTLPNGDRTVGHCTQFAILRQKTALPSDISRTIPTTTECYRLISKIDYPIYSEVHTEEEVMMFLLEKIAQIRPRPPNPLNEDEEYHSGWGNSQANEHTTAVDGNAPSTKPSAEPEDRQEVTAVELGVLPLDDLWLSLDIRQRCKTRNNMIKILEKSPLLKLDLEKDRVVFDDEDEFWKAYDRKITEIPDNGSESSWLSGKEDDWDDDPWDETAIEDVECQQDLMTIDWNQTQGQQLVSDGWESGNALSAENGDEGVGSGWLVPVGEPSPRPADPWDSM